MLLNAIDGFIRSDQARSGNFLENKNCEVNLRPELISMLWNRKNPLTRIVDFDS
jgi:hypothetical protein